ncbi:MAG: zf-HC2 domain-containing protein [Solirubrobacteraceae bacterium]|nr:zf-HC2 domain-containing protein [Solirubrobacteraceae bacterium]
MTVLPTSSPTPEIADETEAMPEVPARAAVHARERVHAHALVADIARLHGDALLRTARRHSACADDAHDAYQRAMELLLAHAGTIDRGKAVNWLQVVVRREAMAISRSHERSVPLDDEDVEELTARMAVQTDERLHAIDLAHRAGEALATLKEAEAQALCMRAQGLSYEEIAAAYGWSYTKVNRAVTEGRRAFVDHYLAVERGTVCGDTAELLSRYVAGDLKPRIALKVRAHLVRCSACRSLLHAERHADAALQALLPTTTVVAAGSSSGWLHDHLLAPVGHLAGRLTPAADHLVGSKLGVAAASTIALAGSGVAVEHQLGERNADPPPAIRTALTSAASQPASASPRASITLPAAIAAAEQRGGDLAASAKRRAQAKERAAAKARAKAKRAAANRGEFGPAGGEFSGPSSSGTATGRASKSTESASAGASAAPPAEVTVTDSSSAPTVDVAPDAPSSSAPTSGSVSDEFGP